MLVRTNESKAAAAARIGAGRARRKRAELLERLRPCFARAQTWQQAGRYVSALLSEMPKRNGWTIAQHAGDQGPDRTQRLLNRASWDTLAAMSEVRRFAAAGLEEAAHRGRRRDALVIGALDETGQEKAGEATVMHASMIISGPDLVAYRRNILCAGESVGTGIPDLLPRVRRTRARGRSNLTCLSLYLKEGATRALPRLVCWAYLSLLPRGVASQ